MPSKLHISIISAIKINLLRESATMNRKYKISDSLGNRNILYYDAIAADYDKIMSEDDRNLYVRSVVSGKFLSVVHGGYVLDFGGGTGQDLGWLIQRQYRIVFCEPSRAMRAIAMQREETRIAEPAVIFFEDERADFRNWKDFFPFGQQMDAVLANFAVLNCIPDLKCLFDKLTLALKPGGHVLALVLDDHLLMRLRSNTKGTIGSFFSGSPVELNIDYKNQQQKVYIHSIKTIKSVSKEKFDLSSQIRLKGYGFRLIHLVRK